MQSNDIKFFKAINVTDTASNGGRMSYNEYTIAGGNANILPDISPTERVSGITRLRKVFIANHNAANEIGFNPKIFLRAPTDAGNIVTLKKATATDTQSNNAATRHYGACNVVGNSVAAGATSFQATIERSDINPFVTGDTIVLLMLDAGTGAVTEREYHSGVTITTAGTTVTVTLASGDQIAKNYSGKVTVASVIINDRSLTTEYKNTAVTSAGGSFNFNVNTLIGDNIGTYNDVITLTMTSATAFNATSLVFGSLGSGNISSDFSPINPSVSRPYFTLKAAGFTGVMATGDTLTFEMVAASFAVYFVDTVPAGISSYKNNKILFACEVDTL